MFGRRRPSAALVISIIALVFAVSGTAVAARHLISGDSLIRKHSLSGDRLRNDSVTGQQIKLSSLGQVPRAKNATSLDGHNASEFALASDLVRSGLVTASAGQTVKLASFGPFTLSLQCNDDGSGAVDAAIMVTSTTSGSEAFGSPLTAGMAEEIDDAGPGTDFTDNAGGTLEEFVAPPDAYVGDIVDGVFMPGTTAPCAASILVGKS